MNYEELYEQLTASEKKIKDIITSVTKSYKAIVKDTESGDIRSLQKTALQLQEQVQRQQENVQELLEQIGAFDVSAYFENGDFTKQLLDECREQEIDVVGDFPSYEMFPYRVKIDAANQDVYLDRKKMASIRPFSCANMIKAGQEKLMKASFNENAFANELAEAYDVAVMKSGKKPGADIYLTTIYKQLAPMARFRKDYDQQSFAFDIARLYSSGLETVKDGRGFQLGTSRNINKAIRILDREGNEQYFSTIRFYEM